MKRKYRVFGTAEVVVSTVVEMDESSTPEEKFREAASTFSGIRQYLGNGGSGEKLVGVEGENDTIIAVEHPTFDDYMEEP